MLVCTLFGQSFALAHKNAFVPARGEVVQAIDQGAVAVHQHRPTLIVLHVCLHPETAQEHHPPEPARVQGGFEIGKGPLVEWGRGNEEDKVHPHIRVVAPRPPAVDKLLAQKVLVPNVQAAEDLNLWPFTATSTTLRARPLQHAPHQPSDLMLIKLIMPPIRWRQLEATRKPMAAKVMQVTGQFSPKIFQD